MNSFDLAIIGSGPAGYVAAIRASQLGAKVCVVEKDELGGVCLNRGCIPTKTLLKTAELLRETSSAEEFGVSIDSIQPAKVASSGSEKGHASARTPFLNLAAAMKRKDQVVSTLVRGIESLFKSWKIETIKGQASFVSRDKILVKAGSDKQEISADAFLVATGSAPSQIPALPVDGLYILNSDQLLKITEIPRHIIIVGAGAIGCEWAFIMKNFGAEVTLVEMLDQVAPSEDEMVGELLGRELKKLKIKLLLKDKIEKVDQVTSGVIAKTASGQELRADRVLVSVGRTPNSRGLGLDKLGCETDPRGFIKVNAKMETSIPKIYAAGDVCGGMLLAHKASAEAKVAVQNALGRKEEMDYTVVPSAIFTSPEAASVGLREKEAKAQGINYGTGSFPVRALGKAQAMSEIAGEIKFIFAKENGQILGCHIVGPRASELIHEAALALKLKATVKDIAETIHVHPTISEGLMEAAEACLGQAVHLPKPK